jgi:DNA-binding response OmpR family regulator
VVKALRELNHIVAEDGWPLESVAPDDPFDATIADSPSPSPALAARFAADWPEAFHIQIVDADDQALRIAALRAGADACFARPVHARELGGKLDAMARRSRGAVAGESNAGVALANQSLTVAGVRVSLSRREFLIVELLSREPGRIFTAEEIHDRVWGGDDQDDAVSVRACVSRLNTRLARAHGWWLIRGQRGRGYRLALASSPDRSAQPPPARGK